MSEAFFRLQWRFLNVTPINLQRAALQLLRDCESAGLTHLPTATSGLMFPQATPEIASAESEQQVPATPSKPVVEKQEIVKTSKPENIPVFENKPSADNPGQQLAALAERVAQCVRCQELAATRTQTVFGVGNPTARVMFIGEAPGADEDQAGEPFVGKAGQLLNKIIDACGWSREELYICNILRCRPPGNRNPTDEEANNCREYLDGQISLVNPEYIVCWGSVAAKNLLHQETPIGKMRGQFFHYGRAKVLCTYHPSYLLRNPEAKKPVWEDMKFLLNEMGLKPKNG